MTAALPMPADVRLMNGVTLALLAAFALMLLGVLAQALARHPAFAIRAMLVQGDVAHNNAVTLRANVTPHLAGGFFTLDLQHARKTFEAVPWVRHAQVHRLYPNRLRIVLQEHQAVAYWGAEGESRLLNSFGEVFEANAGDVEADGLVRLNGPQGQEALVLAMHRTLAPLFETLELPIEQLELSARGGWRAQLEGGAVIELGRGTAAEIESRVQGLLKTVAHVAARYGRTAAALESADLRHTDGYALRLQGVTIQTPEPRRQQ